MKLSSIATIYFGFSNIIPIHANEERIPVVIRENMDLKGRKLSKKTSKKNSKKCPAQSSKSADPISAVYTMTNSGNGNEIAVFERNINTGKLIFAERVSTGGDGGRLGLPDGSVAPVTNPLSSTNAIIVAGKCLLAVNAGSNTVSSFRINSNGRLTLADEQSTGGEFPVSLAESEGLVYVINAGLDGSLSGFNLLQYSCSLSPIADSTIDLELDTGLSSGEPPFLGATPSQISVTPEGNFILTVKGFGNGLQLGNGRVLTYEIDTSNGKLIEIKDQALSDSTAPFSFDITNDGVFLLTEAFGNQAPGTAGAGAISIVGDNGLEERIGTTQTATCWLEYSETTGCIFTTNTDAFSMSSALLTADNKLELKNEVLDELGGPIDLILSPGDEYLYVIANNNANAEGNENGMPTIYVYDATSCHCDATQIQSIRDGLPTEFTNGNPTSGYNGVAGIAVWQG